MSIGLLGKKIGMTRVYDEDGAMVPVTVVEVSDNTVLQVRNGDTDGYTAVQVGYDAQRESRMNKPELGHFKKAKSEPKRYIKEFRTAEGDETPEVGSKIGVDLFEAGQFVDIIGTSKGKGFQGAVKRHGFGGLKETHGSMMHRRTGAIGPGSTPGRVWKNTKMPGRMGTDRITIQNLKVVEARPDDNVILISGAIPGAKGGYVVIRPAVKKTAEKK